ncbi:MAG: hypothetical protein JWQ44_465 [Chthoniobacter sp.]|jgi:hypothetical protein|nr:hypothetical protein [Chthoniobacter sp.]
MKLDLARLQKRFQNRGAVALTLESARVAIDVLRRDEAGTRVVQSLAIPIGADALLADPEKAGAELAAQLDASGVRERRCVVCVPPGWALTTSTELPEVAAEDLRSYLELRAEREFPIPVTDLRLAHCAYALPDGKERATLAALPAKRMEAIERMLQSAGCRAVSVSLGLDECVTAAGQPAAMHFLANGNHVDLVIASGGGIAALRSLPTVAEHGATLDTAIFSREVRITLGRLPEAVRQQVREAQFGGARRSAETLCNSISGHLSRMGIESRLATPTRESATPNAHPGAAIAAAEQHLIGRPVAFEFLAPQANRWQVMFQRFDSRRRRLVVGAAIGFVILPLFIFMIRSQIESSLESEWKGMQQNVAELDRLQQNIRQFRPWFEPAPHSLQIIEGIASAFPESGDVWAKSIQLGEGGKVTCTGFARNQGALMSLFDRLRARPDVVGLQVQQVRGENPIQFSVVYKWEAQNAK